MTDRRISAVVQAAPARDDRGDDPVFAFPTPAEGTKPYIVCFALPNNPRAARVSFVHIKIIDCSGFYLFQLPNAKACSFAYCAAPSDKPLANDIKNVGTDCVGGYDPCSAACETAAERVWVERVQKTGFGLPCSRGLPEGCYPGQGDCVHGH